MYRFVLLFVLMIILVTGSVGAQTTVVSPNIFLRGMQLPTEVRYTAAFVKPSDDTRLRNVSVEITLPPEAFFLDIAVSKQVNFSVIRVNRQNALTLIWQIGEISPTELVDAFSFTVARPLQSEVEFYMEWKTDSNAIAVENFFEIPPVTLVTESEGAIFPVEGADFQPVGNTGVQLRSAAQDTILGVTLLDTGFNPPPEYGDVWWCSLLEITGLAEGTTADVIVPLRRSVAPFTELFMFQQQADGSWLALDSKATVTADGLFAVYTHPGGLIATGGDVDILAQIVPIVELNLPIPEQAPPADNPPVEDNKGEQELAAVEQIIAEAQANGTGESAPPGGEVIVVGEQPTSVDRNQPSGAQPPESTDDRNQPSGAENVPANDDRNQPTGAVVPEGNRPQAPENAQATAPEEVPVVEDNKEEINEFPTFAPQENTEETTGVITFSVTIEDPSQIGSVDPTSETGGSTDTTVVQSPETLNTGQTSGSVTTEQTNNVQTTESSNPGQVTEPAGQINTDQPSDPNQNDTPSIVEENQQPVNTAVKVTTDVGTQNDIDLLPFGEGGFRVEIVLLENGTITQCQFGQITCQGITRRFGAGFR